MSTALRPTILVVDDNAANLALAEATLEDEGYRTLKAASGEQALATFHAEEVDCVLLDAHMPGINGFEVCARIRRAKRGADIPIVFLTAVRDLDTFDAAQDAGADDFLTKPVRPAELAMRVRAALKLRKLGAELRENYDLVRQQRDALMRLQLQKERLTAFVVHDLKNPVNTMDLYAQLLARDKALPATAREAALTIRREAHTLNRLILNLLDITKSDEGQLHVERTRLDTKQLVETVLVVHQHHAHVQQVGLANDVADDCVAHADEDLLTRILENLVDNALRHAPRGSSIRIVAEHAEGGLELRVCDQGTGIAPGERERIFERHVRLDAPSSSRHGHGLGLTFCKAAAEAHGGSIWVADTEEGTVFCLRIPDGS